MEPKLAIAWLAVLCASAEPFRGTLVSAKQVNEVRDGAVVLRVTGLEREAALHVRSRSLPLYYWIEVGRDTALADKHPEWMASLQGHTEWRRFFLKLGKPAEGEVVKNYPWAPVMYQEAFDAHLGRVKELLRVLPSADGIFLNNLQGAPSACGCGNSLCRWTPDYGPIRTATRLAPDAAARFVAAVQMLAPKSKIIPVWMTECEERDKEKLCAGVGCFGGACWREWTAQLMPLAEQAGTIAVMTTWRALERDAGWVERAVASFTRMPPRQGGRPVDASRLIAIVEDEREHKPVGGTVVAREPIEQDWEPRIVRITAAAVRGVARRRRDLAPAHPPAVPSSLAARTAWILRSGRRMAGNHFSENSSS
jgi:hypothetical protein